MKKLFIITIILLIISCSPKMTQYQVEVTYHNGDVELVEFLSTTEPVLTIDGALRYKTDRASINNWVTHRTFVRSMKITGFEH